MRLLSGGPWRGVREPGPSQTAGAGVERSPLAPHTTTVNTHMCAQNDQYGYTV